MADKQQVSKTPFSADWFLRGALTRIGDTFDRFTGRRWVPSSSLATSELIERMKRLMDSEAREVPGKGRVVPHNIRLKIQWDKFSTDSDDSLSKLEEELLVAAADHVNDSLYYTYAPLKVEAKPDYFTEGVKLYASFDRFAEDEPEVEMNVTIAGVQLGERVKAEIPDVVFEEVLYVARFSINKVAMEKRLDFTAGRRNSVGRTPNNDLALSDTSVSKIHASLVADGNGDLSVADTGSTNGTFINGERIAYGKSSALVTGDKLKFGVVEVVLERIVQPSGKTDDEPPDYSRKTTLTIDDLEFTTRQSDDPPILASDSVMEDTAKVIESDGENSSDQKSEPTSLDDLTPADSNDEPANK